MEDEQVGRQPSDTDRQISGPAASDFSERQPVERPMTPAAPVAIPKEALLAITQALKLSNTGSRTEIRLPSFNGERDLTLFEDVVDASDWSAKQRTLHICSQLTSDAQGCGHGDSYQEITEDLHARFRVPRR